MMDEAHDKIAETVGLLNHALLTIVGHAELKEQVRLNYVNHMWDHDRPYWYLWYHDCAGVYKMELRRSEISKGYDWIAQFNIKYYPSPTEPSFQGLSTLEKLCRTSDMFDSLPTYGECDCPCHGVGHAEHEHKLLYYTHTTGTPHVNCNELIPAEFFFAGSMWIAFNSRFGSIARLQSQTSWKTVMQKDLTLHDDNGDVIALLKKGEVDRDYPGFALSHFFYQRVVKSWSLVHHYMFQKESSLETDGLICRSDGYSVIHESSPEVQKITLQAELRCTVHDKLDTFPFEDSPVIMKNVNGESGKIFTIDQKIA